MPSDPRILDYLSTKIAMKRFPRFKIVFIFIFCLIVVAKIFINQSNHFRGIQYEYLRESFNWIPDLIRSWYNDLEVKLRINLFFSLSRFPNTTLRTVTKKKLTYATSYCFFVFFLFNLNWIPILKFIGRSEHTRYTNGLVSIT